MKFKSSYLIKTVQAICFVAAIAVPLIAGAGYAQDAARIHHVPMPASELPYPGAPMEIKATLINSRNSQLVMRAFVVKDGKVMDMTFDHLSSSDGEHLEYSTKLPAPLGELSYQLVLSGPQGVVASSKRFFIRRECLPVVTNLEINPELPADAKTRLKALKVRAIDLQNEVQNYESVVKLLAELKSLTD